MVIHQWEIADKGMRVYEYSSYNSWKRSDAAGRYNNLSSAFLGSRLMRVHVHTVELAAGHYSVQ